MAYFKNPNFFIQDTSNKFDALHNPGVHAPYSGLYRCHVCGNEADSTKGKPLPPEHHPYNAPHQRTRWQLIAASHPV